MKYRWNAWRALLQISEDEYNTRREIYRYLIDMDWQSNWERDIEKDLKRTFPHQEFFVKEYAEVNCCIGQKQLERVLKIISFYYEQIGYSQGMNYIAAFLLLISGGREEETFILFV